jgi:hypothetical protein
MANEDSNFSLEKKRKSGSLHLMKPQKMAIGGQTG